ncbi:hypothetical protein P175DRAFT_0500526 [Aspergillus ochraceoroseus IBT 24754]|uniref:Uncharacterized protein n=1 Tax=Aspergillus ochraceoroseus IBT 24754 TaxID=1392256 RepID=A0A2T5LZE6_9EURO|nr:uncharacterized protein P175DRAFT_0500526 [Aspergillus ochraceoroseus IBT 24754]PTU21646.1 hypothetical protein P175DRAFT_0500526 [Aspergillus ochraceoroseus IBT 24754]
MCLSAPILSSFDLVRFPGSSASSTSSAACLLVSNSDRKVPASSLSRQPPTVSAPALFSSAVLLDPSVDELIWVGVGRPS